MPRVIRYFQKKSEVYVGEYVLPELPLIKMQKLFDISHDNPMYDSYLISEKEGSFFKENCEINFDFTQYDYYLEYDDE